MHFFWRVWSRRFPEPDEITKLVIGAALTVLAFLVLAAGAAQSVGGARISLWWAVAFHVINSIGFAHLVPVALALYVRMAPKAIGATIVHWPGSGVQKSSSRNTLAGRTPSRIMRSSTFLPSGCFKSSAMARLLRLSMR